MSSSSLSCLLFCHFFLFGLASFLSLGSILWFLSWEEANRQTGFLFWCQELLKHIYKNRSLQLHARSTSIKAVGITQSQAMSQAHWDWNWWISSQLRVYTDLGCRYINIAFFNHLSRAFLHLFYLEVFFSWLRTVQLWQNQCLEHWLVHFNLFQKPFSLGSKVNFL